MGTDGREQTVPDSRCPPTSVISGRQSEAKAGGRGPSHWLHRAVSTLPLNTANPPFAILPAVPAALSLVLGIVTVLAITVWRCPSPLVGTVCGGLVALTALLCRPGQRWLCLSFPLGLAVTALHVWAPWQTYTRALPREECAGQIRGCVTRSEHVAPELAWMSVSPRATVDVSAFRWSSEEEWTPSAGRLLLQIRAGGMPPPYGTVVEAEGTFLRPRPALFPGAFDYRTYLWTQGIRHIFHASAVRRLHMARGWRRAVVGVYRARDFLAHSLVRRGLSEGPARALLALTLGYRQGVDAEARARLLRSGTVHLFAISGLHVGMVCALIVWTLRLLRVPFRVRWAIVPVFLGAYVFMTGGRPSAVRAWLMLSVWSASKAVHRPPVPMNAVALSAWLLLVFRPLSLLQMGFQFSFTIVVALLAAWPLLSKISGWAAERRGWVPRRARAEGILGLFPGRRVGEVFLASLVAWLASTGLVAWYNGLFIPGAVLTNTAVAGIAFVGVLFIWPKLLLGLLPFASADVLVGRLLEVIVRAVELLAELGSKEPLSLTVGRPALWAVALYYGSLALLLFGPSVKRLRVAAGIAACGAFALMAGGFRGTDGAEVTLFSGGDGATPSLVLSAPSSVPPLVVNTGGRNGARALVSWLGLNGHGHVEQLVVSGREWGECGGVDHVLAGVQVRTLVLPAEAMDGTLRTLAVRHLANGGRLRTFTMDDGASSAPLHSVGGNLLLGGTSRGKDRTLCLRRDLPGQKSTVSCRRSRTGKTVVTWSRGVASTTTNLGALWRPTMGVLRLAERPSRSGGLRVRSRVE